ncbi:hypothetical protein Kpol_1055p11 [Vanderwaltozyma polyspora DSM 70294]|uniref:Ribosome quality control complex subunit 1 n=1 Tax=Vanderwaltozyma polyspora (strain ATCC 22028 / DSM 70294 / BCRC 21397 / CBS 2163 / NBRC 10782 / NRRL Y-8283 / UCD 57-17) TaxID=436907 RepID=A7TG85_VANPO|nr:uncharacterized protein Kpol_1055p11 [Vanderwaltozyma polyspora DSM 70294]EDO18655.1 hypothetical protein Kpol_1055p11 [Vanderwaltozyma polyspora DSM 70294]
MSSRALKRLQNDDELLNSIISSATVLKSSSKPKKKNPMANANIFALMGETSDNEGSESENETEPVIEEDESEVPLNVGDEDSNELSKVVLQTKSQKTKNKKKKKKKSKTKSNNVQDVEVSDEQNKDDEEFDKILQQFQKKNARDFEFKIDAKSIDDNDEEFLTASEPDESVLTEKSKLEMNDIFYDTSFSKFPISCLKRHAWAFNNDFRKLDPHTEFKLLFDDISAASLEDIDSISSTHISPQQLKQIQRLKRLVKNWSGKDHRNVPNGPGGSIHRLQFTKIRDDWLPTTRGELSMKSLNHNELLEWQLWQRPIDWKDTIEYDLKKWEKEISYFNFEPVNIEANRKGLTEFYMSVVLHPDHEALVSLISSKYPYHVAGLLQVAVIMIRQGDRSNTNGLIQRALFVFDRALKSGIKFDSISCQLPYIYFYNRQFYLAIFRYMLMLVQRGAVGTASEWCKSLWSLSPMEDPLGCRYFMDHYLLLNNDFQYLINLSKSPLLNCYKQWYTLGLALGIVLSYLRIGEREKAQIELKKSFKFHSIALAKIYKEKLLGEVDLVKNINSDQLHAINIETKAYMVRFETIWKNAEDISFLRNELTTLFEKNIKGEIGIANADAYADTENIHPFYINDIPINLLRFVFLSDESSVIATIPQYIWSDYQVFEFDIFPPEPTTKESIDTIETIKSFISEEDLLSSQMELMQDENILNQIRQLSLDQYLDENPNVGLE